MSEKQLYVCLEKISGKVFFASLISRQGAQAELRSSWEIEKGMALLIRPVPEQWDGGSFTPEMIAEAPETVEAHINRTEGRGTFLVRILSDDQKEIIERVRTGGQSEDNLQIKTLKAGMVLTVKLEGRITLESAARIQTVLHGLSDEEKLLLFDLTHEVALATSGIGMLFMIVKEKVKKGRYVSILVKPESRIEEILSESKISEVAQIFTNRDDAVACLLQKTLE